jgi:hydroxyacylglutathione hydrolase
MQVEALTVGIFEVNCYLVWDQFPAALVIDPGADAERIIRALSDRRLSVAAYLLTHGHADHVSALAEVYRSFPAPVAMHAEDARWAFTAVSGIPPFYSVPRSPPEIARLVEDGSEWLDGGLRWRVIATPGHSPGGVSFHFPDANALFPGDTLFQGSVGRTDVRGGSARVLSASIARLAQLANSTVVYPGHGPSTTIGQEKKTNFFLREAV